MNFSPIHSIKVADNSPDEILGLESSTFALPWRLGGSFR